MTNRRFISKLPPFLNEIVSLMVVGGAFIIFRVLGELDIFPAAAMAVAVWIFSKVVFATIMRWAEVPQPTEDEAPGWEGLDLDRHLHRHRLQLLFDQYGVTGSMNVRDGLICPVVPGDQLSPLAKRLRNSAVRLRTLTKGDPHLFYTKDGMYGLADLTVMEVEQAATVIERVAEDRKASRKLYRGFGTEEQVQMARVAVASYIRNTEDSQPGAALTLSNEIRDGKHDDHPFMQVGIAVVGQILQIKGNDI